MSTIKINDPILHSHNVVTINFDVSWGLRKYFRKTELILKYDCDITDIPESIFTVPALTLAGPVAWATDSNIEMGEIDRTCLEGMKDVQRGFQELYPDLFNTDSKIKATPVDNEDSSTGQTAMLFSGGVDSTTTFYRRRKKPITLINIVQERDSELKRERQRDYISTFSETMDVDATEVFTNAHSVLDVPILGLDFHRELARDWWNAIHYGIYYMAVCAPFAYKEGISNLYQGSSYTSNRDLPEAQPFIVESLEWTGTEGKICEVNFKRHEKIGVIADFVAKHDRVTISSCYNREIRENCMDCEKCFRTALGAASVGVLPSSIGFEVTEETIANMKSYLVEHNFSGFHAHMWSEIQDEVDSEDFAIDDEELMNYLLDCDINTDDTGRDLKLTRKKKLYSALPFPINYTAAKLFLRRKQR